MLAVAGPLAEIALIKMREPEAIERVRGCNGVRPILNYVPAMAEKLATGVKLCLLDDESEVQKAAYAAALLIVQTAPKTAAAGWCCKAAMCFTATPFACDPMWTCIFKKALG